MKQGTNAAAMKIKNKKIVLDLIRRKPLSRVAISEAAGLTKAAVTFIADSLLADGLIKESVHESGGVGRRPTILTLNENACYAVGVNITREYYEVGVTNLVGKVLAHETFDTAKYKEVVSAVPAVINNQISKLGIDAEKILGVGICTPGPVDYKNGVIINPPNFKEWHNINIVKIVSESVGILTKLENISNGRALAEKYYGIAADAENFLLLVVDGGIGTGIVINNSVYRGARGLGSELGHTSIKYDGLLCGCGNVGCLEKYASMKAILMGSGLGSWRGVIDNLHTSNIAKRTVEKEAEYLSAAIVSAVNLFDLDTVVLSGDINYKSGIIINMLNDLIKDRILNKKADIKSAVVENGVIAAATSVIYDYFN